jgi:ribokinase
MPRKPVNRGGRKGRAMIYNLGSINADQVYSVPHLPQPGETLAATALFTGLGGKGANMSVAAARAGAQVRHIGAVGSDGQWAIDRLAGYGVDTAAIAVIDAPTGHAIINVDPQGENAIVIYPGANVQQDARRIETALAGARPGDWLLLQNETSHQAFCAETGSKLGLNIAYAAAPFDADAVKAILPFADLLILNAVEMAQLTSATGQTPADLGVDTLIVTRGADGCTAYRAEDGWQPQTHPAPAVTPIDTTGAGDTFTGYLVAGLDAGLSFDAAITRATNAAALMVTKKGTADAIPPLADVLNFTP